MTEKGYTHTRCRAKSSERITLNMIKGFDSQSKKLSKEKHEGTETTKQGGESLTLEELVVDIVLAEVPKITRDELSSIYPDVSRDVVRARDVIIVILHALTGADAETISAPAGRLRQDVANAFKRMRDPNDSARRDLLKRVCDRLEIEPDNVIAALR